MFAVCNFLAFLVYLVYVTLKILSFVVCLFILLCAYSVLNSMKRKNIYGIYIYIYISKNFALSLYKMHFSSNEKVVRQLFF